MKKGWKIVLAILCAFETLTPEGLRGEIDAALAAQERYDVSHLHALAEENEQIARKLMEEA